MNVKNQSLFSTFAGVALADILANGVAIIMLMIVVTIMIKHEQEAEKIEQAEEVSVLLSREIASSAVMNSLPTSAPARLHNYHISPLDRNPHHNLMPILEVHQNHVRNYYTNTVYSREELLFQDNALDDYLISLNKTQKRNLRVDIYHIGLFYIFISILKKNNSVNYWPRHWHFLDYDDPEIPAEAVALRKGDAPQQTQRLQLTTSAGDNTEAGNITDKNNDLSAMQTSAQDALNSEPTHAVARKNSSIPEDITLNFSQGAGKNYPYDDLAFQKTPQNLQALQDPSDLPGASDEKSTLEKTSNAIFDILNQAISKNISLKQHTNQSNVRKSRFRTALASGNDNNLSKNVLSTGPALNITPILRALFDFMEQVQTEADMGGTTKLAHYVFSRDILSRITRLPPINNPQEIAFFHNLTQNLNAPITEKETIFMNTETNEKGYGMAINVPINQRIQRVTLVTDIHQIKNENLPDDVNMSLRAGLYPEIYRGLRIPITEGTTILMPEKQYKQEQFIWRVITLVSPNVDDFVTAFVYSAVDENNNLLIASEENAVKVSKKRLNPEYPSLDLHKEQWQIFLYGIIATIFIISVLFRFRRT